MSEQSWDDVLICPLTSTGPAPDKGLKARIRFEIRESNIDMILDSEVKLPNPTTEVWQGYAILGKTDQGEWAELHRQNILFPPGTMMTLGSSS